MLGDFRGHRCRPISSSENTTHLSYAKRGLACFPARACWPKLAEEVPAASSRPWVFQIPFRCHILHSFPSQASVLPRAPIFR